MKKSYLIFLFLLVFCSKPKQTINKEELTKELDSILLVDQKYRTQWKTIHDKFGPDSQEMKDLWAKQQTVDSSNLQRIIKIIEEVGGYPGKSLVGYSASETTFFVLQHAPDSIQEKYYELILEAGKNDELENRLVVMYQDRYLMHRGEPQIFGTQIRSEKKINPVTNVKFDSMYLWPIADTTRIDSVRMWNGLGPLEQYLNNFGLSRWK
ncbi:MAG TPA: DUF6624 domain-containing protein [Cytophagales bacterium]|nr:DUF6624 domain-containing protein [Cytophagales bacterium]